MKYICGPQNLKRGIVIIQIKHNVDYLLGKYTLQFYPFDRAEGHRPETGQSTGTLSLYK